MHTCSQLLQIILPAYTPAIRRLRKNPPDHFWAIPAGHPLEKLAWPLLENITTNACKSYQESTPTKHFVCLAVLSARSLSRPNLNQTSTIQTALFLSLPIRRYTPLYAAIRPGYTRPYTPNYIAKTQGFSMSFNSLLKNQQAHLGMLPYSTIWYHMVP